MARRSLLFTPGDEPAMLRKAPGAGADALVFDLEDAVAPPDKAAARRAVRDVLSDPDFDPGADVYVRVNPPGVAADDDLAALATVDGIAGVVLPKADAPEDVDTLGKQLAEHGLDLPVLAQVESAAGVLAADAIACADRVDALVFGAEDFAADIGATRTDDGTEVLYARERVVVAAGAAGVDAIDTVYTDFGDVDGLRDEARFALTLGFDGKLAIHPAQVDPINEAFTPDTDDVAWARRVIEARDDTGADGVLSVDGEMIDAPLVAQAERILDRARAAGR